MASTRTEPISSYAEGSTSTSREHSTAGTAECSTKPLIVIRSAAGLSRTSCSTAARSGPSPTTTRSASSRIRPKARTSTSACFCGASRPT